jgi:hypothetical protein
LLKSSVLAVSNINKRLLLTTLRLVARFLTSILFYFGVTKRGWLRLQIAKIVGLKNINKRLLLTTLRLVARFLTSISDFGLE